MSAGSFVLDEIPEDLAAQLDRQARLLDLAVSPGFEHHLGEIASEVRRLRYRAEPDSSLAYLADRLASHVEGLWLLEAPTAADLYRAGLGVDEAIERADRHVDELRARMGGKP